MSDILKKAILPEYQDDPEALEELGRALVRSNYGRGGPDVLFAMMSWPHYSTSSDSAIAFDTVKDVIGGLNIMAHQHGRFEGFRHDSLYLLEATVGISATGQQSRAEVIAATNPSAEQVYFQWYNVTTSTYIGAAGAASLFTIGRQVWQSQAGPTAWVRAQAGTQIELRQSSYEAADIDPALSFAKIMEMR